MDIKLEIAMAIDSCNKTGDKLSYVVLGKKLGVPPSSVKKEVRQIRRLHETLGENTRKYFHQNCRDMSPVDVGNLIVLLPVSKQQEVAKIYPIWRKEYMSMEGVL